MLPLINTLMTLQPKSSHYLPLHINQEGPCVTPRKRVLRAQKQLPSTALCSLPTATIYPCLVLSLGKSTPWGKADQLPERAVGVLMQQQAKFGLNAKPETLQVCCQISKQWCLSCPYDRVSVWEPNCFLFSHSVLYYTTTAALLPPTNFKKGAKSQPKTAFQQH